MGQGGGGGRGGGREGGWVGAILGGSTWHLLVVALVDPFMHELA